MEAWTQKKGDAMSIYWYRRIMVIIAIILAVLLAVKAVQGVGNFLSEEFHCVEEVTIIVELGDTITELASEQVQSGNCTGYEPLSYWLSDNYGPDIKPGDRIIIPKEG